MKKDVVWQLLRRNISVWQLAGYAVANLVGMIIVLTAVQFYGDVTAGGDRDDGFISRDYLILSKQVSGLGSLLGGDVSFSQEELDDLSRQEWVHDMGKFTASGYNVYASVEMGGYGMSTYLFFESIPDEFFDIRPDGWTFDEQSTVVPIIISKDYLTLYNFGFAASRGLPQVSESMVGLVPLRISISGRGRQRYFDARIVGFSSRLNTIAVPQSFMSWANENFADEPIGNPSRVIIEAENPGDPAIEQYLDEHGYELAGDKQNSNKMLYLLTMITGVVIIVGVVITLLAFFILLLSVYLLLQKNREKLRDLLLLGYSPGQVAHYYNVLVMVINLSVLVISMVVVSFLRSYWSTPLLELGFGVSSMWSVIIVGSVITILITIVNVMAIRRNVIRNAMC